MRSALLGDTCKITSDFIWIVLLKQKAYNRLFNWIRPVISRTHLEERNSCTNASSEDFDALVTTTYKSASNSLHVKFTFYSSNMRWDGCRKALFRSNTGVALDKSTRKKWSLNSTKESDNSRDFSPRPGTRSHGDSRCVLSWARAQLATHLWVKHPPRVTLHMRTRKLRELRAEWDWRNINRDEWISPPPSHRTFGCREISNEMRWLTTK